MNSRLRYYFNSGAACFVVGYLMGFLSTTELIILLPFVYNAFLWRRMRKVYPHRLIHFIALFAVVFTVFVFITQYQYRGFIDGGCMRTITDMDAAAGYMGTMVLFTVTIWELGVGGIQQLVRTSV